MNMADLTSNKNQVLMIHVWPEPDAVGKVLCPDSKPVSDEREEEVWERLRSLTTNPNVRRDILVMTCSQQYAADHAEVLEEFQRDNCMPDRIKFLEPHKETRLKWHAKTKRREEVEVITPFTLACATDAKEIANYCHSGKYSALLIWHPRGNKDHGPDGDDLRYLTHLKDSNVRTPIYIFHDSPHSKKWGVEVDGDANRAYRKLESGAALWDTQSEMSNAEELPDVIKHIAHEGESTWIFGYAKHGKTWIMLCIVKSLLTGEPLFNVTDLEVPRKAKRVIYLCPEAGRTSLRRRLKMLGLMDHLYDPITNPEGRIYLRSLSKGPKLDLDNPTLLELAKGADIFIDTAIRYLEGDENNSGDVKTMTEQTLNLLSMGARTMWVAHHSGKSFTSATEITLDNCARGSSEFAAALTNAIGVVQLDKDKNLIHFHYIDGRDQDEPAPDMHLQGRPHLSEIGNFQVTENVERFKGRNPVNGRPEDVEKQAKLDFARTVEGTLHDQVAAVNEKFGSKHSKSTLSRWISEEEAERRRQEGLTVVGGGSQ
jgi:hypothetical protein